MHQRRRTQPAGFRQKHLVRQGQQAAGGVDAVGERRQEAHVRQLCAEELPGDEGIGVAVGMRRGGRLVLVGDHQRLPRLDGRVAAKAEVPAVELPEGDAILSGNPGQGLAGLDDMKGGGPADHQGLAYRQGSVPAYAVELLQQRNADTVPPRDAVKGFSRLNYMYFHTVPSLFGFLYSMREGGE